MSPSTMKILAALERGDVDQRQAEQLLGFLQACRSDALPSRATWFRRARALRALGISPPPLPASLR